MSNLLKSTCAVDYLTTTWPAEIRDTILASTKNVMDWARSNATLNGAGNWVKPWAWQGYVGHRCGPVMVGQRIDGCILRLESVAAHAWFSAGLTAGHNISRIDLAATVWSDLPQSDTITRHKEDTVEHRKSLQSRPYKVRLIDGVGDGDTLYIGSRESAHFTRIYDKERSPNTSPEYKGALRYEVECKEELARQAYEGITRGGYSVANCYKILGGLLKRRGIDPVHIGCVQSEDIPHIALPRTDVERSLAWLAAQVKPTLQNLMRMGYEEEALKALGLDTFWRDYGTRD